MKRFITTTLSAMVLSPVLALAQEEQPVEVVEEPAAEEAPAAEAAPAEGAAEGGDPTLEQDVAASQPPAEEGEDEPMPGEGAGYLDAYWLPTTDVDLGGTLEERGDGMGGRAQYQFWNFLAATAEYTSRTLGETDEDLTDMRAGVGVSTQNNSGDTGALFLQWEKYESDLDEIDGYAVHARWGHDAYEWLTFSIDLGYGRLEGDAEKASSREASFGLLLKFGMAGIFADWRRTMLEGEDSGAKSTLEDVRVGARLRWGG